MEYSERKINELVAAQVEDKLAKMMANFNPDRFRKLPCKYFLGTGCKHGNACTYLHTLNPQRRQRSPPPPPYRSYPRSTTPPQRSRSPIYRRPRSPLPRPRRTPSPIQRRHLQRSRSRSPEQPRRLPTHTIPPQITPKRPMDEDDDKITPVKQRVVAVPISVEKKMTVKLSDGEETLVQSSARAQRIGFRLKDDTFENLLETVQEATLESRSSWSSMELFDITDISELNEKFALLVPNVTDLRFTRSHFQKLPIDLSLMPGLKKLTLEDNSYVSINTTLGQVDKVPAAKLALQESKAYHTFSGSGKRPEMHSQFYHVCNSIIPEGQALITGRDLECVQVSVPHWPSFEDNDEKDEKDERDEKDEKESKYEPAKTEVEDGETSDSEDDDEPRARSRSRSPSRSPSPFDDKDRRAAGPQPAKRQLTIKTRAKRTCRFHEYRLVTMMVFLRDLIPVTSLRVLILGADMDIKSELKPIPLAITHEHLQLLSKIKSLEQVTTYFFDFGEIKGQLYHFNNLQKLKTLEFYYPFGLKAHDGESALPKNTLEFFFGKFRKRQPSVTSIKFHYKEGPQFAFYPARLSGIEISEQLEGVNQRQGIFPSLLKARVQENHASHVIEYSV